VIAGSVSLLAAFVTFSASRRRRDIYRTPV
jgi:hypothetical protein